MLATGILAPATVQAESLLEKIAMTILSDRFGIDTSQVSIFQQQTQLPVYDLAPTYQAAHYFDRSPQEIRRLRNQGLGWGEIAKRVGMQPGEFNRLRNQGAFDRDRFWDDSYRDRFGASNQTVSALRKSGGSHEDILGAILAGKLGGRDPQVAYNDYRDQRSWTTVTKNYNVRFDQWRRVTREVHRHDIPRDDRWTSNGNNGVRDHGKGVGKGKSQGRNDWKNKGKKDKRKGNSNRWDDSKGDGAGDHVRHQGMRERTSVGKGGSGQGKGQGGGKGGSKSKGNGRGKGKG